MKIKNTDLVLNTKTINDKGDKYNIYDILVPLDFELIESFCGAQYSEEYKRITSNGDYIEITDDEIKNNQISLKKLTNFKAKVLSDIAVNNKLKEIKNILKIKNG
jgi:hypothetical protein